MTGVSEFNSVRVISAAPETLRVSVIGGRTQLDVALPADVPVAAFLPELAQLISSRDARRPGEDTSGRDERRSFWVLSRVEGNAELAPEVTLRDAGVTNGELLRITQRRALSPPTLFDDVVDAAARLNRASYAAWDATAAGVMAIGGLWAAMATWIYFLLADALAGQRVAVVVGAVVTVLAMAGGAALAHRALGRADLAAAAGPPVLALSAAIAWTLSQTHSGYVRAAACGGLLAFAGICHRVIGAGHGVYIASAVVFGFAAVALSGNASAIPVDVLATVVATVATLGCLAVTPLTARLGRVTPQARENARDTLVRNDADASAAAMMPSAEQVWARVRSAALARAGLWAGLTVVAVVAATTVVGVLSSWAAWVFALVCAAVMALHSRRATTIPERAALAVPAAVLVLAACVQAQGHAGSLRLAAMIVLTLGAVVAVAGGLLIAGRPVHRWVAVVAANLEYLAAAALLPVALWPLGIYERLGW